MRRRQGGIPLQGCASQAIVEFAPLLIIDVLVRQSSHLSCVDIIVFYSFHDRLHRH